jgi:hypothetical protein
MTYDRMLSCDVLCRQRPFNELIPHERSPNKCLKRLRINSEKETTAEPNP